MNAKKKDATYRIDELLVKKGFAATIDEARIFIMAGQVIIDSQAIQKPSQKFREQSHIVMREERPYVGRGYLKLQQVLDKLSLGSALKDLTVLDIGASTGGFTECVLDLGAARVLALDVGVGQLAWKLRCDPRVINLERTDIRNFGVKERQELLRSNEAPDWILADVSFNSLSRLMPAILPHATPGKTKLLLLIKPQFELPRADIPRGGVVTDESLRRKAVEMVKNALLKEGVGNLDDAVIMDSETAGASGNREIFLFLNLSKLACHN